MTWDLVTSMLTVHVWNLNNCCVPQTHIIITVLLLLLTFALYQEFKNFIKDSSLVTTQITLDYESVMHHQS